MTHLWLRAEQRANEERVGLLPDGAAQLIAAGFKLTVEDSASRAISIDGYKDAGCTIASEGSWTDAPQDAVIFGLKELPDDGTSLPHRHIMFGHAYKGQPAGQALLGRFRAGGGSLYDLEYLLDDRGRRIAAFGYWAGYAGAAVALESWAAQQKGGLCGALSRYQDQGAMIAALGRALHNVPIPRVLIIGALGRVGTGAADLCRALNVPVTPWDMAETAHGGPFPEILDHDVFLNCILAQPGCPVFVPQSALDTPRMLRVIGDIACDPTSDFSPIKVYDRATDWASPALRVADHPPLDVTAIDNLPSLLPIESSQDFAAQLLPAILAMTDLTAAPWQRAKALFDTHLAGLP